MSFEAYATDARKTNPFGAEAPEGVNYALDYHTGIDLVFANGLIRPVEEGKVVETGFNKSYGNYVWVENTDGYYALYAHLKKILVGEGEIVHGTSVLGTQGSSGNTKGEHLHLEIRTNKDSQATAIDPEEYLDNLNNFGKAFYTKKDEEVTITVLLKKIVSFFEGISDFFINFGENFKNNMVRIAFILVAVLLLFIAIKSIFIGR